jgi:hypothetical protein
MATTRRRADAPVETIPLDHVDAQDAADFREQVRPSDCELWTGARSSSGYGVKRLRDGRNYQAHRVSFVLAHGPIPDGLVIDHLCRNKLCVNPRHLEAVSSRENTVRAIEAAKADRDAAACLQRALRWIGSCGAHYLPLDRLAELERLFPDLDPDEQARLSELSFAECQEAARDAEVVLDAAA